MEEKVYFNSGPLRLSGLFSPGLADQDRGVVVTHPHPLYGGNMFNSVVEAIVRVYQKRGCATLRFNFRGTGESQGTYDEGRREQDDICAAGDFLAENGGRTMDLAGYSFGAWVAAKGAVRMTAYERLVMVSPPVALMDFGAIGDLTALALVITGSDDEIAPPAVIEEYLPVWNPNAPLQVIDGADHFFFGFERDLETILAEIV